MKENQMATATDLERSTFQDLPAYRYIRASDKLPSTDAAYEQKDPIAKVKLFNPVGAGRWWIAGYDPETRLAWGVAELFEREMGDFDMAELVALRGMMGLPIERDLGWSPKTLRELLGG
jgi:hypothetical protein